MDLIAKLPVTIFLGLVALSIRYYIKESGKNLGNVSPKNKKEAKKYVLIENLWFFLVPEIGAAGFAIMIFFNIDIHSLKELVAGSLGFLILAIFCLIFSENYSEKWKELSEEN